jgi:hypothetical protein
MVSKGRNYAPRGSASGMAKLSESAALAIRARVASGAQLSELALEYGVHRSTIESVVAYKTWRHV